MKTVTIKNTNDFTVNVEEYIKPTRKIHPVMLLNVLDVMDNDIGHEDCHIDCISAKMLVSDIACHVIYGNDKCLDAYVKNDTFKNVMKDENADFVAAMAVYTQWAGSAVSMVTDVFFSMFNAIKNYVSRNWSETNRNRFYMLID